MRGSLTRTIELLNSNNSRYDCDVNFTGEHPGNTALIMVAIGLKNGLYVLHVEDSCERANRYIASKSTHKSKRDVLTSIERKFHFVLKGIKDDYGLQTYAPAMASSPVPSASDCVPTQSLSKL